MHRRAFLRGVAVGATGVGGVRAVTAGPRGAAAAHVGPYRPLGSVAVENAREAVPDPGGEFAYVAATDGFVVVDVKIPRDPQVVAEKRGLLADRETGPLRLVQDLKVDGDRLVVAGPADPVGGDVLQGFLLYDVSDPANPEQLAFHETQFPIHNCFLRDGYAYLTGNNGEDNPLVVVDVRDDRPAEVARWSLLDRDEAWGDVPPGVRTLHDVTVRDGRAYIAHWDAGTYILDVSDPTSPSFVARVGGRPLAKLRSIPSDQVREHVIRLPGNAHYAMVNDDGSLLGVNKEAWAVDGQGGPGGVELWDVSTPAEPTRLATVEPPASPDPAIGGTWTTSHNFDIVGDRLYTSWYQGGVKIHDVSDPATPERLAWWRDPDATSFWTAKLARDRFFVSSSYGHRSNGKGGLYTFPNHPGQQKDPPALTTTAGNASGSTGGTTATPDATTTATTEKAALAGETTTTATGDAASAGDTPGFGIAGALAGLVGAGAWRRRRR